MKPIFPTISSLTGASYAVARHGGAPPELVRLELDLPAEDAARYEQRFRRQPRGGPDAMRPRFARHDAHVRSVLSEGGYPVLKP